MKNENRQSAAEQIFKPIKDWEDLYEITNDGKVWSIRSGKFLKPRLSMDGYERVALCRDGKNYEMRVHRLVAEAFIENPNNLPQINHKDFNRRNNVFTNLEWCDDYTNTHYSIDNHRAGYGNQLFLRQTNGQFGACKAYTFTNVFNGKQFTIIGIKNIVKQFGCSIKNVKAVLSRYDHSGQYVKAGMFKGLRVDSEYLKVHRLTPNQGVGSSDPKYQTSLQDEDIVKTSLKDEAVLNNDAELTTPRE